MSTAPIASLPVCMPVSDHVHGFESHLCLTIKRSTGVSLRDNLKNFHAKVTKLLKPSSDITRSPKTCLENQKSITSLGVQQARSVQIFLQSYFNEQQSFPKMTFAEFIEFSDKQLSNHLNLQPLMQQPNNLSTRFDEFTY